MTCTKTLGKKKKKCRQFPSYRDKFLHNFVPWKKKKILTLTKGARSEGRMRTFGMEVICRISEASEWSRGTPTEDGYRG